VTDRTLAAYIRHAERFGTECVVETFTDEQTRAFAGWHRELRRMLPPPVELTWLPPHERERVLDEREAVFADYRRRYEEEFPRVADRGHRLQAECDALDNKDATGATRVPVTVVDDDGREHKRAVTVGRSRRRRLNGEAAAMAQALQREGLITSEIAEKLGVSFKHAQRLLGSGVA
jgi:hypothetical protein